ncbi:MAG: TonB-dependent receptor, partial [Alphaproteobacteria bacterium]|nr:TonB-dependent receptor [Alphaproteobacteria bacterium]
NYELGVKSSMLDGALITEFDAFTVHWSNIQLFAYINGYGTYANGGTARSDGAEWSVNYTPLSGLTLGFNGSYTDARLTEDTPANVGGKTGDRLPSSPMWETSFSASYEQPLFADYSSFEGVDWHYTGSRMAEFEPTSTRQKMPQFNIIDLRAGVENQDYSLTFSVKNVANKLAINYVLDETSAGGNGPQSASVYQPRTFMLALTAKL